MRNPSAVLRIALPVALLLILFIVRPAILRGILGSPRAMLIVAGVIAATVGWSALARRRVDREWVRTVVVLTPATMFAAIFVAPYFGPDQVVDEALPGISADADAATPQALAVAANQQPSDDPAPTSPVRQPAVESPPAVTGPTATPVPTAMPVPTATPSPEPPSGPIELSRGTFGGLDGHHANGDAVIFQLPDGSRIVRLDQVDLQRVPEPYVYVVPSMGATAPLAGSVNLGALRGNVGSSNYTIPADYVLGPDVTVLVWCEPFASPVGAATQTFAG
ncbi:MAG: DM13 domain-containing protein [Euzebya sp.]